MATKSNEESAAKIRIFIVDRHPLVGEGLSQMTTRLPDMVVCGVAQGATAALQGIATTHPDFLIVDISLQGADGLDLLKNVRVQFPALPVLIVSMHDESLYAERQLPAGANSYSLRRQPAEKVLSALHQILTQKVYLRNRIANRMLRQYISRTGELTSSIAGLSDREWEVFRLIGEGHSTRQIAEELHLSIKTVESYQAHIKGKLSLKNGRELVQRAIQWSIGEGAS